LIYDYAVSTEKHLKRGYVDTRRLKTFVPMARIALSGSPEAEGQKGKLVSPTYIERQLHKATISQDYSGIESIKVQARNASVKLWDMTIYYRDGPIQIVPPPGIIYRNSESPYIELEESCGINIITFSLNAVSFSEKPPELWIWGR
jgi:hypothetical protein